jgi:hypothetical protein
VIGIDKVGIGVGLFWTKYLKLDSEKHEVGVVMWFEPATNDIQVKWSSTRNLAPDTTTISVVDPTSTVELLGHLNGVLVELIKLHGHVPDTSKYSALQTALNGKLL